MFWYVEIEFKKNYLNLFLRFIILKLYNFDFIFIFFELLYYEIFGIYNLCVKKGNYIKKNCGFIFWR